MVLWFGRFVMKDEFLPDFEVEYKKFLVERLLKKIDGYEKKYHQKTELLNADFLGNYFLGLFEVGDSCVLSVDNTKKKYDDVLMRYQPHEDGYRITTRNALKKTCPEALFKKFLDNGLYASESAKKSKKNNYLACHRLICCISEDIFKREVHHDDEKPEYNSKENLKAL